MLAFACAFVWESMLKVLKLFRIKKQMLMGAYLLENVSDLILHGQQKRFGGLSSFDDFTTNVDEV